MSINAGDAVKSGLKVAMLEVVTMSACSGVVGLSDSQRLIQTEAASYQLALVGEGRNQGLEASIPYTFENRTGGTVYLPNCRGDFALRLEHATENGWEAAWSPIQLACLGPPIVIQPGSLYSDTLYVWGGLPGTNGHPQFSSDDPSGTYRIVWIDAVSEYHEDRRPFGPQIAHEFRISNQFELRRE